MPATLLNAPARPLLTRLAILVLSMAVLAVCSLAIRAPARRQDALDSARPAFTRRRITTLPAVVVTASDGMSVVTSTADGVR
jgi:hypothetical protein